MKKENTSTQIPSALISPEVVCSPAFGRCIRKIREERGLTMLEVSKETGIHYTAISSFERGVRGKVSAEKAMQIYDYLIKQPLARTPLPTGKHSTRKKQKHRRAKVEKQPVQTPEAPIEAPIPEEPKPEAEVPEVKPEAPKPVEQPKSELRRLEESSKPVVRSVNDLVRETSIRALHECISLIKEIDDPKTSAVVRTVNTQTLVALTNFIKENREVWA